jgi:ATP-binding cassette subfamily C protein
MAPDATTRRLLFEVLTAKERRQAGMIVLLVVGAAVLETAGIGAVLPLMQLLVQPDFLERNTLAQNLQALLGLHTASQFLVAALLGLLLLFLVKNLYLSFVYYVQARYVAAVEARLGTELLAAFLHAPFSERLEQHSADRVRIISTEVGRSTAGFLAPLMAAATEIAVAAGITLLLVALRPTAALVVLAVVSAGAFLAHRVLNTRLYRLREVRVASYAAMCKLPIESLSALKEVQSMARERFFIERFRAESARYAHATALFNFIGLAPRPIIETVALLALVVGFSAGLWLGSTPAELVPAIALFGVAAMRLMPSASRLLSVVASLRFHAPSVAEVADGLRRRGPLRLVDPGASIGEIHRLELEGVAFRYPGASQDALRDISFSLAKGELVAVTGRSGAGKSTLVDLLLGLIEPSAGRCKVNGEPVESLAARLRGRAGLVPQSFYILDDSVRRNVAFGEPEERINDARVLEVLRLAHLDERIARLPSGIEAPIGENAGVLSGGERQRLALARALYHDPDILVLDEVTSALDAATEAELMVTLREISRRCAVVMVTHREASLHHCDRVIVLSEETIVPSQEN